MLPCRWRRESPASGGLLDSGHARSRPGVLRSFGIERADLVELPPGGTSRATWKARDAGGSYVLRRHDRLRQPPAHVASELTWLDALARRSTVPTPVPVRQANGVLAPVVEPGSEGRLGALWTLLDWVDGETLGRLPDDHEAGLIGSMLAALHLAAQEWSPPPGFVRPAYDAAHFEDAAHDLLVRTGVCNSTPAAASAWTRPYDAARASWSGSGGTPRRSASSTRTSTTATSSTPAPHGRPA